MRVSEIKLLLLFLPAISIIPILKTKSGKFNIDKNAQGLSFKKTPFSSKAYPLYMTASTFKAWYNENGAVKIMFQFEYNHDRNLTLAGWAANDDDYMDYDPSIVLLPDVSNDIPHNQLINFEDNNIDSFYLGNLKLKPGLVKKIYTKLCSDTTNPKAYDYIVFIPLITDDHVCYTIFLSKNLPHESEKFTLSKTRIAKVDPSPPAPHK